MKKFLTLLAFGYTMFAGAQQFDRQKMDSLFQSIEQYNKGMGSISIHKSGDEIYQNSIGYSDVAGNRKADKDTRYRIGSISKTFTAAMIMQLVEEGKLDLETKLAKFYRELPNAEKISVEDLLRHQSGLFNFTSKKEYLDYMEAPRTKEELLEIFKENGTAFSPGEKNEYSNTNYVLLSFLLEDIEKAAYPQILQKRITGPLGLENTYYGGKIDPAKGEALSYTKKKEWEPATETDLSIPKGAGGIVSTASDLNEFFTALFIGKVVSASSLDEMKTMTNDYGIGLFSYPFNDKQLYGHTGGIDGFSSMAVYAPEEDLAITFISNAADMSTGDIMAGAMSIYFGNEYAIPEFSPTLDIPAEELEKFTGTYGSETFPLKVEIFLQDGTLMGQATGQPSFPLEAYEENKFQFTRAGLKLEFDPEANVMTLLQGGNAYELSRE